MRDLLRAAIAAALFAFASSAAAAGCETLAPDMTRELPAAKGFLFARDVAWLSDTRLLIGARGGVSDYSLASGAAKTIISGADLPMVYVVDTDGETIVASNLDYGDVAFDLAKRSITKAHRRPDLWIFDMAVRGRTLAVLALPVMMKDTDLGTLWIGEAGAPWRTFRLLRAADPRVEAIVRNTRPPYGGAVVLTADGNVAAITPAEPGVLRYTADGTPLPALGAALTELTIPRLPEIVQRYKEDIHGRYRNVLNHQPLADDLIDTTDGLAIVVRRWRDDAVWWELWFPDARGAARRVRLGIEDRREAGGHMRCDARGRRIACVYDRFTARGRPGTPHLAMFDLSRAKGSPCR